ncbi:unnamed protein product (macronuclear) [Paramecium tetraurelia]|uniref:DUF4378 domain-containing protein n=1 Tax=Paramecium tetraurelia TaxID=5888 RepID=A0D858_PARTE|nr:uncharacterized protein GSPATT00014192001 [Paramecium tetraurelia]CAK79225.1 unnamed protein product [Paramecium tetraurelia]|eukprot:XP_001446622.1 hypothetical protein (macronuclear) [Paramecium tetraurelia strain d4-2]
MQNNSPIKGRRISNQIKLTGKVLKKKTASEVEIIGPSGRDMDTSVVAKIQIMQYENLKSHMQQCQSELKVAKNRHAAIKKSQQLYKKKKKSTKIKKSVSAERVKSQTLEFSSPEYVRRKKAATFFNEKPNTLLDHRERLGLSFLNKIGTKRIDQILERNRMSSIEQSHHPPLTPEKHRFPHELKHYMKEKKKFYSQLDSIKQQSMLEKKKHIDENLRSLAEIAKRNSLSNSRSPPRDSTNKVSAKPLMLSYVANRKSTSRKSGVPKSLKEQFKQLEARYKTLKSNSDVISLRESRNYEHEMKEQAAKCIQRWFKGFKARKLWLKKKQKKLLKIQQFQQMKDSEMVRWDNLKAFLQNLQVKQDMVVLADLIESLIRYADFNKENVLSNTIEQPQIKLKPQKLIIEKSEVFPPQIGQILYLRGELIKEREKKEKQILKDLLVLERISPRSFGLKEQEIQKWGEKELEALEISKQAIKDGWFKAYETIQKTQKDLRFVQKLGDDHFSKMMPVSVSQSNLLKNQLNDLKINLLRASYSEENLIDQKKKPLQHSDIIQFKLIKQDFVIIHPRSRIRDVPIETEEQGQVENLQYVQTHVGYVKQYLEDIKLIVKNQYQNQFLQIINLSIGPSPFEILRFFRLTEEMLEQSLDGGFIHQAVLNLDIFSIKEKVGTEEVCVNEMERIHNKAIFDAFNEALDYHRPFGIKGRPLPWRKNVIYRQVSSVEDTLEKSAIRVMQWAETLSGILLPQGSQVDNDILPQVREERLDKMLKQEIFETDDRWQEFDEEHTEVALELSELIFNHLITEVITELKI